MKRVFLVLAGLGFMAAGMHSISAEPPPTSSNEDQLQSIQKEIDQLTAELHSARVSMMNRELQSQEYLKYEWTQYSHAIENAEQAEQKVQEIEQKLSQLRKEKEELLKQSKQNQ